VGVFATDRWSGEVFGASNRLWRVLGECLGALGGLTPPGWDLRGAWTRDGYVPSRLAQQWGRLLFDDLGEVVLSSRPDPRLGPGLHPVAVYRRGDPAAERYRRTGEQLSPYDTALATPALRLAQFLTASAGFGVTTLRPPAPGDARSEVAVQRLLARSGLLSSHRLRVHHALVHPAPARPPAPRRLR